MSSKEGAVQHLEIAEYLIQRIQNGTYSENEKIPSEHELCQRFQVNRHVVRQAISRTTSLGWVTPLQGKGCYVNKLAKPIQYVLPSQTRFSDNMQDQGVEYLSKLLEWKNDFPTDEERQVLELASNQQVYRLEILRFINNRPLSITTTTVPEEEFPNLESHFSDFHSLYQIFIEKYQIRPIRSKSLFQAILPILKDAELLEMPESIPIIQIESMMNHPSGSPIEYSIARIRADMQKYLVEFS